MATTEIGEKKNHEGGEGEKRRNAPSATGLFLGRRARRKGKGKKGKNGKKEGKKKKKGGDQPFERKQGPKEKLRFPHEEEGEGRGTKTKKKRKGGGKSTKRADYSPYGPIFFSNGKGGGGEGPGKKEGGKEMGSTLIKVEGRLCPGRKK